MFKVKQLFRRKEIPNISKINTNKHLGAFDLVLLGVGCTIGTGIFVLTGIGAAKYAGPAISLSYILSAIICVFVSLAYAELASSIPITGSSYSYTYIIFGEFIAWMVGWALILEYMVGASTVSVGWSGYMSGILKSTGLSLPHNLSHGLFDGGIINLPAVFISVFVGFLLIRGTKESAIANRIFVFIKLLVIFIFLVIASPKINTQNWSEFLPFGWNGVVIGAGVIFFGYVGFDAVSTATEDTKNPKKDIPIGIIGSLLITAILYTVVSLVLTGIAKYTELNNSEPLAHALRLNGSNIGSALVATGAIAGMTSVILVLMYGQSRIFLAMSRDGLLPKLLSKTSSNNSPYMSSAIVMVTVTIISGFVPIDILSRLTSIGTLLAFSVVSLGVLVIHFTKPNLERPFKCPAVFLVAPMSILGCLYLMISLISQTFAPFVIWSTIGLFVYFIYGFSKSLLAQQK